MRRLILPMAAALAVLAGVSTEAAQEATDPLAAQAPDAQEAADPLAVQSAYQSSLTEQAALALAGGG